MKKPFRLVVAPVAVMCCALLNGQSVTPPSPVVNNADTTVTTSVDQQRIDEAHRQIAKNPTRAQTYNELALACIRNARDTDRSADLNEAETAIQKGLSLAPGDFQLEKAQVALLLQRQEYVKALNRARELSKLVPDDVTMYGYVAEAAMALGNYDEAEKAVQWMINMRPNNVAGLLLGADLRVLYGDTSGALEFLNQAFGETPQIDPQQLAWIANKIAEVEINAGQLEAADQTLVRVNEIAPGLPATLTNVANLRIQQRKPVEAVTVLQTLLADEQAQQASQLSTLYLLADAQRMGALPEAAKTFALFKAEAEAASAKTANDNTDLILYYAGSAGDAPKALHLAQQQDSIRHDVWALDAYAWALYANSRYPESDAEIQKALILGIRSARTFNHAGEIALKLNQPEQAAKLFASALQVDPNSAMSTVPSTQIASGTPVVTPHAVVAVEKPVETKTIARALAPAPVATEIKDDGGVPTTLLVPRPTGTASLIRKMQAKVSARPEDPAGYAGLGAAFFQRARETGDVEDYQLAEQALNKSLELDDTDLSAAAPLESMAEVCMGEHRFNDALTYAQKALTLGSGDLSAFAIVGDAYADMGEYEKASIAYSRIQPVSSQAVPEAGETYAQQTRTAYLKFVAGDTDAAIREMQSAVDAGVQARLPSENLAWLYFELGEFSYQSGKISAAADAYMTALTVSPGNYRALAGLGKVRSTQGKFAAAITLYQSAIAVVPMPIYIAELGDIYARTGDAANAEKQYKLVEYIGLLGHINQVLHNRDLALFYADHDRNLSEALTLARKEFEVRSDIYTWDALAWALYKNGKFSEANDAMSHAQRLGTKDAILLFHAGMISAKLGHEGQAIAQLNEALNINPNFNLLGAPIAKEQLGTLHPKALVASGARANGGKVADVQ